METPKIGRQLSRCLLGELANPAAPDGGCLHQPPSLLVSRECQNTKTEVSDVESRSIPIS